MAKIKLHSEDQAHDDALIIGRTLFIGGVLLLALGSGFMLGGWQWLGLFGVIPGAICTIVALVIGWWIRRTENRIQRTQGNARFSKIDGDKNPFSSARWTTVVKKGILNPGDKVTIASPQGDIIAEVIHIDRDNAEMGFDLVELESTSNEPTEQAPTTKVGFGMRKLPRVKTGIREGQGINELVRILDGGTCQECEGRFFIGDDNCPVCHGFGTVPKEE